MGVLHTTVAYGTGNHGIVFEITVSTFKVTVTINRFSV